MLRQVLRDRAEDYRKLIVTKLILEHAIGNSMFVAESAELLWQRRTAAAVFIHSTIAAFASVMTTAAQRATHPLPQHLAAPSTPLTRW